jgi:hypothetical protein
VALTENCRAGSSERSSAKAFCVETLKKNLTYLQQESANAKAAGAG